MGFALAKAIKENLFVGFSTGFAPSKDESNIKVNNDRAVVKVRNYYLSPFCRKFKKLSDNFYIFGQGHAAFTAGKISQNHSASGIDNSYTRSWDGFISLTP